MRLRATSIAGVLMLVVLAWAATGIGAGRAAEAAPEGAQRHDFGEVRQGAVVEHAFALRNDTGTAMHIAGVQLTPPLQLARTPARIAPNDTARLVLRLDTARVEGGFQGALLVQVAGEEPQPRAFVLHGRVVPEIEVLPRPAFFLSTVGGEEKSASLDILNHGGQALRLSLPAAQDPRYRLKLEELDAGKRYRLTATLPSDAAAGEFTTRLSLQRGDGRILPIGMNGRVRQRVHTFPDAVDFGRLAPAELADPAVATQNLMVYQHAGTAFEVRATSDVPGVMLEVVPGSGGDKVQVVASLDPRTPPGDLRGSIFLATNDPKFPRLRVPVTGEVVERRPAATQGRR